MHVVSNVVQVFFICFFLLLLLLFSKSLCVCVHCTFREKEKKRMVCASNQKTDGDNFFSSSLCVCTIVVRWLTRRGFTLSFLYSPINFFYSHVWCDCRFMSGDAVYFFSLLFYFVCVCVFLGIWVSYREIRFTAFIWTRTYSLRDIIAHTRAHTHARIHCILLITIKIANWSTFPNQNDTNWNWHHSIYTQSICAVRVFIDAHGG